MKIRDKFWIRVESIAWLLFAIAWFVVAYKAVEVDEGIAALIGCIMCALSIVGLVNTVVKLHTYNRGITIIRKG